MSKGSLIFLWFILTCLMILSAKSMELLFRAWIESSHCAPVTSAGGTSNCSWNGIRASGALQLASLLTLLIPVIPLSLIAVLGSSVFMPIPKTLWPFIVSTGLCIAALNTFWIEWQIPKYHSDHPALDLLFSFLKVDPAWLSYLCALSALGLIVISFGAKSLVKARKAVSKP